MIEILKAVVWVLFVVLFWAAVFVSAVILILGNVQRLRRKLLWLRLPMFVPKGSTSWVFIPWTVISRKRSSEVSRRHYWHEVAHCVQIEEGGWLSTIRRYFREARTLVKTSHPMEHEAHRYAEAKLQGEIS